LDYLLELCAMRTRMPARGWTLPKRLRPSAALALVDRIERTERQRR
jgi:hypothetical protein